MTFGHFKKSTKGDAVDRTKKAKQKHASQEKQPRQYKDMNPLQNFMEHHHHHRHQRHSQPERRRRDDHRSGDSPGLAQPSPSSSFIQGEYDWFPKDDVLHEKRRHTTPQPKTRVFIVPNEDAWRTPERQIIANSRRASPGEPMKLSTPQTMPDTRGAYSANNKTDISAQRELFPESACTSPGMTPTPPLSEGASSSRSPVLIVNVENQHRNHSESGGGGGGYLAQPLWACNGSVRSCSQRFFLYDTSPSPSIQQQQPQHAAGLTSPGFLYVGNTTQTPQRQQQQRLPAQVLFPCTPLTTGEPSRPTPRAAVAAAAAAVVLTPSVPVSAPKQKQFCGPRSSTYPVTAAAAAAAVVAATPFSPSPRRPEPLQFARRLSSAFTAAAAHEQTVLPSMHAQRRGGGAVLVHHTAVAAAATGGGHGEEEEPRSLE